MTRTCRALVLAVLSLLIFAAAPAPAEARLFGNLFARKQAKVPRANRAERRQMRRKFRRHFWRSRQARKIYRSEKKQRHTGRLRLSKWANRIITPVNLGATVASASVGSPWAILSGGATLWSARTAIKSSRQLKQAKYQARKSTLNQLQLQQAAAPAQGNAVPAQEAPLPPPTGQPVTMAPPPGY